MAKTWVLDAGTKGTGARMVPLEDVLEKPKPEAPSSPPGRKPAAPAPRQRPAGATRSKKQVEKRSTPLAAGHVRKKSNGEIGRVVAIDAKAGTASVKWLRDGRTSTVPISSVTRK
jgi:hypothetical protein